MTKPLNLLIETDDTRAIDSLVLDSRVSSKNGMFFCIKGIHVDSHKFVNQAIGNGCVAIVHSDDIEKVDGVYYHKVDNVMDALHAITSEFYDHPSKNLYVYGITGTNGKSTTMKTVKNVLSRLGVSAGYVGTISVEYADKVLSPSLTTPDIVVMQSYLKDMVDSGVKEVCLEVSSQGLALHRVDSIDFDNAAFTNLSHDHLDYHKTMDAYFGAKKIMFDRLKPTGFMVINSDDDYGQSLLNSDYKQKIVTYGIDNDSDYMAKDIKLSPTSTEFVLVYQGTEYPVKTSFVALFNVYNTLCSIALLHQRGYPLESIIPELVDIEHVEGRQTRVDAGQPYNVFVDYGHAPDSMKHVLEFVREITPVGSKVISIFGSAGDRDQIKRPEMGSVADALSDYIILTEDDNHSEAFKSIIEDVEKGITQTEYEIIEDRYEAIKKAISMAKPNDSLVLFGKGKEQFIYRSVSKVPWIGDDIAVETLIKEKGE